MAHLVGVIKRGTYNNEYSVGNNSIGFIVCSHPFDYCAIILDFTQLLVNGGPINDVLAELSGANKQ